MCSELLLSIIIFLWLLFLLIVISYLEHVASKWPSHLGSRKEDKK